MTPIIPECLVRLGLDTAASERDVKRAYARELKLIDPALQPREFAELRSAYETALVVARYAQQVYLAPDEGESAPDVAAEAESPEATAQPGQQPEQHQHEAAPGRAQADTGDGDSPVPETKAETQTSPVPADEPQPLRPVSDTHTFDRFVESLSFAPSDQFAARAALRQWLSHDEWVPMAARERFELQLITAISNRRFGARTAAVFLAATSVFDWSDARYALLGNLGYVGNHVSTLLNEMVVLSEAAQQRWLALTEEPDPKTAMDLIQPEERMEAASPMLAQLFFAEGHIDAWKQARAHAPLRRRVAYTTRRLVKKSAALRGMLYLLAVPVVVAIMAFVLSQVQFKEAAQASTRCDLVFAEAMAADWKDPSMDNMSQLKNCTQGIPPLLCRDRKAMLDNLTLYQRLLGTSTYETYHSTMSMKLRLADGRTYGAARPLDCAAVRSFVKQAPWLDEGDEKAARQLVADFAQCAGSYSYERISPALQKLLEQTDAWPGAVTGGAHKSIALKQLLGQPSTETFHVTPLKPWLACEPVMKPELRQRMGAQEWIVASTRANMAGFEVTTLLAMTAPRSASAPGKALEVEPAVADSLRRARAAANLAKAENPSAAASGPAAAARAALEAAMAAAKPAPNSPP